jgi:hypothetical protein
MLVLPIAYRLLGHFFGGDVAHRAFPVLAQVMFDRATNDPGNRHIKAISKFPEFGIDRRRQHDREPWIAMNLLLSRHLHTLLISWPPTKGGRVL